jgi:hypothetical protein
MSATGAGRPLGRVGAWMGIAFAVLFVVGFLIFPTPDDNTHTLEWARWWNDSGHRAGAITGAYLMTLGLLAFVWFAWTLRERVGDGGGLMFTFGSIFAAIALVSALIRAAIAGGKAFGDTPVPRGADLARQLDNIGFGVLLVAGALTAGLFVVLASYLASRSGILPTWLCIAGYVVGALQVVAVFFFPFALFFLWVLIAAIVLVSRSRSAVTASPAGAPSG